MDAVRQRWEQSHLTRGRNLRPASISTYLWAAAHFESWAAVALCDAETEHYMAYLEESNDPVSTKHVVMAACRSYEKYRSTSTGRPLPAMLALELPIKRPVRGVALPSGTIRAVLAWADTPADFRLTYLGPFQGLRIREMRDQPGEEELGIIEWRPDRLVVFGKGAKIRQVPRHPRLTPEIEGWMRSESPSLSQLYRRILALREVLGFPIQCHDFRKTFSRTLEEREVDHDVRRDLLGHAESLTSWYSGGVSWHRMVAAVNVLDY